MAEAKGNKGIFIVGKAEFIAACGIGMNAAVALLIMARGSQGNNRTTSWSCKAISERAGITRARAKKAVEQLIQHGLAQKTRGGTNPQYHLELSDDPDSYIYLPNSIVDGVGAEVPPVERIRQTMDVNNLFTFALLYYLQDIDNEHGLPLEWFKSNNSDLELVYQNDMARLLCCKRSTWEINWQWYATSIFQRMDIDFNVFKQAFHELYSLGLVKAWGITFESPDEDAEAICETYSYSWFSDLHKQVSRAVSKAPKWPADGTYIIVPRHVKDPDIRTSGRLVYLPQTTKTARFHAMTLAREERVYQLIDNALKVEQARAIEREEEEGV